MCVPPAPTGMASGEDEEGTIAPQMLVVVVDDVLGQLLGDMADDLRRLRGIQHATARRGADADDATLVLRRPLAGSDSSDSMAGYAAMPDQTSESLLAEFDSFSQTFEDRHQAYVQAETEARRRNPQIAIARARVSAAEGMKTQAGLIPNPVLTLTSENTPLGSQSFQFSRDTDAYAYVGQTIELGRKRDRRAPLAARGAPDFQALLLAPVSGGGFCGPRG